MVSYIDPLYHVKLQVYNQTDKKIAMHGAAFTLTLIDHTVWADIDADTSLYTCQYTMLGDTTT